MVMTKEELISERLRIGAKICDLRMSKKLTTRAMAEAAGITQANLINIEHGRYSVGLDILSKIAESLGVKIELQ